MDEALIVTSEISGQQDVVRRVRCIGTDAVLRNNRWHGDLLTDRGDQGWSLGILAPDVDSGFSSRRTIGR